MTRRLSLAGLLGACLILVGASPVRPPFSRADWPHWATAPAGGCRTTRTLVLMRDHRDHEVPDASPASAHHLLWRDEAACEIAFGHWEDPYTGDSLHDPTRVDVDHVVSLREAHDWGGWAWTPAHKAAFANWLPNLLAVSAHGNRSKGAKGLTDWTPPASELCRYGRLRAGTLIAWRLIPPAAEARAVKTALDTCG